MANTKWIVQKASIDSHSKFTKVGTLVKWFENSLGSLFMSTNKMDTNTAHTQTKDNENYLASYKNSIVFKTNRYKQTNILIKG